MKTKTTCTSHSIRHSGMTLIELLVVMAVIATLAGVGTPAFIAVKLAASQNAAMQNARQIALGLTLYGADHSGNLPGGPGGDSYSTSNEAFRILIPDYLDDETVFAVSNSPYGPFADGNISSESEVLRAGENHFAYVAGLSTESNSTWPLIVDGTNGNGSYSRNPESLGSVWKGKTAVMITVGGSARKASLEGSDDARFIPNPNDSGSNFLEVGFMGPHANLLDPAS